MSTSLTIAQLHPFALTASTLVDSYLTGSVLSAAVLQEIETYLAAHLASIRSKYGVRERIGEAELTTGYKGGVGLDATPYGEVVKMLDSTGTMAGALSRRLASIAVCDFALDDDE